MKKIGLVVLCLFLVSCSVIEFPEDATGEFKWGFKKEASQVGVPNLGDLYGAAPSGKCRETNELQCQGGNLNRRFECENGPARWRRDENCPFGCNNDRLRCCNEFQESTVHRSCDGDILEKEVLRDCEGNPRDSVFVDCNIYDDRPDEDITCFEHFDENGNSIHAGCGFCGERVCVYDEADTGYAYSLLEEEECWEGYVEHVVAC